MKSPLMIEEGRQRIRCFK